MIRFIALFATLVLIISPSHAELFLPDIKTAQEAYKNQNYKTAYKHWKKLENYHDAALLGLGRLYARGLYVEQDYSKALLYFKKSAAKGNTKAYFEIARSYEKGRGLRKDIQKAQKWYVLSSQNGYERANKALLQLNSNYSSVLNEQKKNKSPWRFRYSLKSQVALEDNLTLGEDNDSSTAVITEGQITARYQPLKDIRLETQIRALNSTGSAQSIEDNDNDDIMDESFIELRRANIEWSNINNIQPLSIKAGRQRFREDRRLWWNDDLDAIKLSYNTTLSSGFLALANNFSNYRLGGDQDFEAEDEERFRVLGEFTHRLSPVQNIEFRFLYENDYSDTANIGSIVKTNDLDTRDHNLFWLGARTSGKTLTDYHYDINLIGLVGEEKLTSSSFVNSELRRIIRNNDRDVKAIAFDAKIKKALDETITGHIGYAFGSGDNGTGNNTSFRQTDLETNTSRFDRQEWQSSTRHYGEVLRPELSNIHILNLGLQAPLFTHHDINVNYFNYWRANDNTDIGRNGLDQNLINGGAHIGQAIDVVSTFNILKILPTLPKTLDGSYLRVRLGSFYAGEAFGSSKDEFAFTANAQIAVNF